MGQAFSTKTVEPLPNRDLEQEVSSSTSSPQQALPLSPRNHEIRKRRSVNKAKVHTISLRRRDENTAQRVKRAIVGESIQVFWTEINAW